MKRTNQTMQTWAIPLGFKIFGQEIGDHTWVASDAGYCEGCRFGTEPEPDPYYCSPSRWKAGKYTPPSDTSRKLESGSDSQSIAECMAGKPYKFMGIPSQSGIVYAINGVCHNLANRTLYPSNVTVNGALGYWFTQAIYGTYGTMVPLSLIPPVIPSFLPPFVLPNPLYVAALAWTVAVDIEWVNIRKSCGVKALEVTEKNEWVDYLRRIQELHAQPIIFARKEEWTAAKHLDFLEKNYERHMQEIDLTLKYRRGNVSSNKISELRTLWMDFHKPSQKNIEDFYRDQNVVNFKQLPDVSLSEYDIITLANLMNMIASKLLQKVIDLLGPDDFKTVYGHAPEEPFLVVNPMVLKNAAITGA